MARGAAPILSSKANTKLGRRSNSTSSRKGMIASANSTDGVTVWGSLQCPYYVHKALVRLFGLPKEKVRVVQTETGGGFGGKEEYPSMIAGHAALLALKSGKPVKMIYDRAEDMAATTKRHPSRTRHRTAVTREGKLLAMEIDFTLDGGAYETLSPVVLSRGTIHAAGPYALPECTDPEPRRGNQCSAARRLSRFWRAAECVCARTPSRPCRRRRWSLAGRVAPPQFHSRRRDAFRRADGPRKSADGQTARSRSRAQRLSRKAHAFRHENPQQRDQARHRVCRVSPRRGIHRLRRRISSLRSAGAQPHATARCRYSPGARRWVRERIRSLRRLRPRL